MGQCSLTDPQQGCGDIFSNSKGSDQSSFLEKQTCSERDRMLWEHELNNNILMIGKESLTTFWQAPFNKTHPCFNQITKDVTRTFPEVNYFGNKPNILRLQKILKKIALYFPHMGYTQGLNFAVGFLMISGCEDEQCFRLMTKMMTHDKILAIGLYQDDFPLVTFYCEVFWILLEKKMPIVYGILKKTYITDDLWLFQWFISLFLYNFPVEFVKKVWDFMLCKKEMAVVLIALGIIKSIKKQMIQIQFQDEMEFLDFVNNFKNLQFVRQYLNLKKIFTYANSITKAEIDKAISQTKCHKNPYRMYFSSSLASQKQQWQLLMKKYERSREQFVQKEVPIKYERVDIFQNLQKMILTKHKLYQSEIFKQKNSSVFRKSNLSGKPFSIKSVHSNFLGPHDRETYRKTKL